MIKVYLVKGLDAHETTILKSFLCPVRAHEWKDNYDGDDDFAFMCVTEMTIDDSEDYYIEYIGE